MLLQVLMEVFVLIDAVVHKMCKEKVEEGRETTAKIVMGGFYCNPKP